MSVGYRYRKKQIKKLKRGVKGAWRFPMPGFRLKRVVYGDRQEVLTEYRDEVPPMNWVVVPRG